MAKVKLIEGSHWRMASSALMSNIVGILALPRILYGFRTLIEKGVLTIVWPNGYQSRFGGVQPGPDAQINIHRWRTLRRTVAGGSVGLAEAYIDGDWNTPDLVAVTELGAANRGMMARSLRGAAWSRLLLRRRHVRRTNCRQGSQRNIAYHYDLGNAFYRPWLDDTMTYSCGLWGDGANSLESAQRRKYRQLLDYLKVRPGERILEIGCGWGGFAEIAARERGARVTGITLSREQLAFARERIERAGLADQVDIRFQDYRDVTGTFDHVVSIEMFEAVGEENWPTYFAKINEVLRPGGRAALQIITIDEDQFETYRRQPDFIQAFIFPGGMLAPLTALKSEVSKVGLSWEAAQQHARDYARTLSAWRKRFEAAWREQVLPQGYDESFRRIWTYYLAYCEGAFRGGGIDVYQIALRKSE